MFCPRCGTKLPDGGRFCFSCGIPQVARESGISFVPPPPITKRNHRYRNIFVGSFGALILGFVIWSQVVDRSRRVQRAALARDVEQKSSQRLDRVGIFARGLQEESSGRNIESGMPTRVMALKFPTPTITEVESGAGEPDFVNDNFGPGTDSPRPATRYYYLLPLKGICWNPGDARPSAGGKDYLALGGYCIEAVSGYTFIFVKGKLDTLIQDDGVNVTHVTTSGESRSKRERRKVEN
jgi:hypothetical protein